MVAAPPVLEIDGASWRFATADDAPELNRLADLGSNRVLFSQPGSADGYAQSIGSAALRMAMICEHDGRPVGAAALTARSNRDRNALLIAMFAAPLRSTLTLAAYVRHVFWMQPLHRLFVQLPIVDGVTDYLALFTAVGFVPEGTVANHALVGEQPRDVAMLGMLRPEFEDWCRKKEPRLAL